MPCQLLNPSFLYRSDPYSLNGRAPSKRGVGCQFGPDVSEKWCKDNGVDYVVRYADVVKNVLKNNTRNPHVDGFDCSGYTTVNIVSAVMQMLLVFLTKFMEKEVEEGK